MSSETRKKHIIRSKMYRYLIFFVSFLFILLLYPKEGKFKYEFQKGKTWLHQTLVAPFDFPIYKAQAELDNEKDSIKKEFKPYFRQNKKILYSQLEKLKNDFDAKWDEHLQNYFKNKRTQQIDSNFNFQYGDNKTDYYNFVSDLLTFIYNKGIIELSDVLINTENEFSIYIIDKNNVSQEFDINQVFTIKSAHDYIDNEIYDKSKKLSSSPNADIKFFESLKINEYIRTNIFFDRETTNNVKEANIENISLTKGLVQKGERIIAKGEVVNSTKYQILESLKKEFEHSSVNKDNQLLIFVGQAILVFIIFLVLYLFLLNFRRDILNDSTKMTFLLLMIVSFFLISSITLRFNLFNYYIIPFALLPIFIRTFYDTRLALFTHLITMFLIAFIVPNAYEFVFMQFITGTFVLFSLAKVQRRSQLFLTALIIFSIYSVVYLGISIIQEGNLHNIYWKNFIWFAANGLLLLSSYPLIFIFEKMFGFLSDATLMELSDTNHPLLRKLAEKAPGTFQHSMQVANLAEEVIYRIHGNPLLARVGALYHDIGKSATPPYFIENQRHGINPHDTLPCEKSAEIIIDHVRNGVEMAKKHAIPQQVIDFITSHHGKSRVEYFYLTCKNENPNKDVDENLYTYPGIQPYSKETAVVMMADSIEAASRSLREISEESVSALINKIINKQIDDGQYNHADITFREITRAKEIFKNKILSINHARIEYPKELENDFDEEHYITSVE